MKAVDPVLAYAIAVLVAVQAAAIGYAVFAQLHFIEDGGTLASAAFESNAPGTGAMIFHALNGGVVLLAALALLIVSFFAKIPQGVDRKSTRLNSSHLVISYAVFCLKKKNLRLSLAYFPLSYDTDGIRYSLILS